MNNLSYTSYTKSIHVIHVSTSTSGIAENITGTFPETYDAPNSTEDSMPATRPKTSEMDQHEGHPLADYQPITHDSILPVHRLLF